MDRCRQPRGRRSTTRTTRFAARSPASRVDYGYLPAAHTNGDLYIHFPEANVHRGRWPVCSESWPLLDWRNGAWLGGLVEGARETGRNGETRNPDRSGQRPVIDGATLARHHRMYADFHEKMVVFQNKGYGLRRLHRPAPSART